MHRSSATPEHDPLGAYRASEPRRRRDPFADPSLRSEIARIAEARARRAAGGWRSALFGWMSAAPRGALAGAALSAALLAGGAASQLAGGAAGTARMEAGADALSSSDLPEASMAVTVNGGAGAPLQSEALDVTIVVSGAALLVLTGSLAVAFVTVRRRRA